MRDLPPARPACLRAPPPVSPTPGPRCDHPGPSVDPVQQKAAQPQKRLLGQGTGHKAGAAGSRGQASRGAQPRPPPEYANPDTSVPGPCTPGCIPCTPRTPATPALGPAGVRHDLPATRAGGPPDVGLRGGLSPPRLLTTGHHPSDIPCRWCPPWSRQSGLCGGGSSPPAYPPRARCGYVL